MLDHLNDDQHEVRSTIDRIATVRASFLQASFCFASFQASTDAAARAEALEKIATSLDHIDEVLRWIGGNQRGSKGADGTLTWVRNIAIEAKIDHEALAQIARTMRAFLTGLSSNSPPSFPEVHSFLNSGWPVIRQECTNLINALWSDLDVRRRIAASELERVRELLDGALFDIKQVSMSVRLVAINATVEAARSGEHGKGFTVIAKEVMRLAERIHETSTLAEKAHNSIADLRTS